MSLLEFQRHMADDVRRPLTRDYEMRTETEDGESVSDRVASYVKPNNLLSSFERLEIYNRQYWFRLIDAVTDDYPALRAVLGERRFNALIPAYLEENPSTSFTLRDLGAKLPEWLVGRRDLAGKKHGLAVDVARLEWAYVDAFDAAHRPALGEGGASALSPESILHLQPHIQLLELRYPVDELVLMVRKETPEIDIVSNAVAAPRTRQRLKLPEMRRSQIYLVVHRFDDMIYYRRIDREAFSLLRAIRNGLPLASALSEAFVGSSYSPEKQTAKIQEYFAHASQLGWFCETAPGSSDPDR
jgi:hypothetical protein